MRTIQISKGQKVVVDDDCYESLSRWKWRANWSRTTKAFYAERDTSVQGIRINLRMHRELMGLEKGDKRQVDHINGDTLDNRRSNLRIVTCSQNLMNRGANKNNKSGFKGVIFDRQARRWRATINFDGKQHSLGLHDSPEDAHTAYCVAALRLHGEFSNFGVVPPKQGAPQCQQQQ